ncbi:MAG: MMPL family transporter [Deltaproteobacteria bacterium]|nr:MMPL family transporter [Deltaproteobacteria bacterium]
MNKSKLATVLTNGTKRWWPVWLFLTLALTAVSMPRAAQLFAKISTDPADLLPEHNPNTQAIRQVREKFKSRAGIDFIFESPDPDTSLRMMLDTAKELKKHPLVYQVETEKPGYDFFDRHKMMYLDLEDLKLIRDRIDRRLQEEKLGGLLVDLSGDETKEEGLTFKDLESKYGQYSKSASSRYKTSADGNIVVLTISYIKPKANLKEEAVFQDAIDIFYHQLEPAKYGPGAKIYISPITRVLEYRSLIKDLTRVGIISGILIFLPLLFRFRNIFHVGLIFLPLLTGISISFAVASFFIPHLNVTTSFLFAILGGLGVENGIHIFSRYTEMRASGASEDDALYDIFAHTGRAILTSVASVAVTFLLLTINEFRGFSEFGFISGTGLWIIFFVYFTVLPSLLILLEKLKWLKFPPHDVEHPVRLPVRPKALKIALVVFAAFSLFSLGVMPQVDFEYNSKKVRAIIPEAIIANEKARKTYDRLNQPALVLVQSKEEADELKAAFEKKISEDKATPTIDAVRSYYDLVPAHQPEKLAVIHEIQTLLRDKTLKLLKGERKEDLARFKKALAEAEPVKSDMIPEEVKQKFLGDPAIPGKVVLINAFPHLEMDDGRNALEFAKDVREVKTRFGHYYPANDSMIFGLVLESMLKDTRVVLLVSILSIALFVFLDFRNVKKTVIVLASILFGVLWMTGVMWMFALKFNFYNMVIVPAVMGISIDNAIHVYHRYEELGPGSLTKVLMTSGKAALLASLTNASGFLGLLLCAHRGLFSIGLLSVIGVGTCLMSTLVFLPAFLQWREDHHGT